MKSTHTGLLAIAVTAAAFMMLRGAQPADTREYQIWQHRNLGKAFYENPTTQLQAVDEFKKALELAPNSAREQLNYGLALLRAGKTEEGIAEIEKAQKMDPKIPHTWFNLGIAFKRQSDYTRATEQLKQMVSLVPFEPVSHYNLGVLYKLSGKQDLALLEFETAAKLNPNLAGPHFQLYNAYRQAGRAKEADSELALFQDIKKRQAGAAVPEDLEWSYFAEIYETIPPKAEDGPPGDLIFRDQALPGKADSATGGLAVLDADADGRPDVLVWSAAGVALYKNGTTPIDNAVLGNLKGVVSIAPGDFNNDGYVDLCIVTDTAATIYINQKGTFQRDAAPPAQGAFSKAVWLDFDHDYDLDLFLLGEQSVLLRNNGAAGFSNQSAGFPFVVGHATAAAGLDLVADTDGNDLLVVYQDRPAVIYRDRLAGKYEAVPLGSLPAGGMSVAACDFNNDGWTDVVAGYVSGAVLLENRRGTLEKISGPASAHGAIAFADFESRALPDLVIGDSVYRNQGQSRLSLRSPTGIGPATAVVAADFDDDGRVDLVKIAADGTLHLLKNDTAAKNNWVRVALTGVKNLKLAPGAHVEVKAGNYYQKRTYGGIPLLFGLHSAQEIDTVRITWPNGLIQNEAKQQVNKSFSYKEAQRLSGSCPMIFTWNGKNFQFITDVLGVAPLGASSGEGTYFPVDHDEYIQIPGEALALVDGRYEIRITEELREVSYLDQVRLISVDHPSAISILTNDKFKSPPFPEFRLFGVAKRIDPISARDDQGRDVLGRILRRDRTYPDAFRRNYAGVADLHHLDVDFGKSAAAGNAILVLNGWVDWADGSTFLGAVQERKGGLITPYIQVKDPQGRWTTVIGDMGMPAGKPKTMVVDLTNRFLSASREIRIVTNICVYWDEVFLSEDTGAPQARLTPVDALGADLRFRGFSQPTIDPARRQPETFDYSKWMAVSMWNPTPGFYTRYGDVRPLLSAADDRLAILGSGDEVRLLFPAADLPPLPANWKRDFLLLVDGWAKDADANTAFSQSVEPLPFHGMTSYPYPSNEQYPVDSVHRVYREQYNTRPALRLIRPLSDSSCSSTLCGGF